MGYHDLGGESKKDSDVWVVAHNKMILKQFTDKYPQKQFVAGEGTNRKRLKFPVAVGMSITDENGKIIGEVNEEKDSFGS